MRITNRAYIDRDPTGFAVHYRDKICWGVRIKSASASISRGIKPEDLPSVDSVNDQEKCQSSESIPIGLLHKKLENQAATLLSQQCSYHQGQQSNSLIVEAVQSEKGKICLQVCMTMI